MGTPTSWLFGDAPDGRLLGTLTFSQLSGKRLRGLGCGNSRGCRGASVMALNGRRSLTLTEWQSLPLVAEWPAFTLFVATFSAPLTTLTPLTPLILLAPTLVSRL